MYRVGIDLGGTNIAVGIVDDEYNIVGRGKIKTRAPRPAEEICDDIANAVEMALEEAKLTMADINSVGIGTPGAVNPQTGVISYSANLKFFDVNIVSLLESRIGTKVYIDNDANAAALGEMIAGAGKGAKDFIAITLGTGVGGGAIIDGKMLLGSNFGGGELGHTVIIHNGVQCGCGRKGCWETYASATGLIRQTKEKMLECKDSIMWKLVNGNIDKVNGRVAFDAMRQNDKAGIEVVDTYCEYIACGIVNIINIFQPEVLCIGGGISNEKSNLLDRINPILDRECYSKNPVYTKLKTAELGNDAGIIGAAMLEKIY